MKPSISVIIPVFNGMPYLETALRSVFDQDTPAHEVIVVDDGSTDGTWDYLQSLGPRIVAKRIPNGGASAARNAGIALASGDVVAFLDHDDVWFRPKLTRVAQAFEHWPGVGFVCSDFAVRHDHLENRMRRHFSTLARRDAMNFNAPLQEHPFKALVLEHFVGTSSAVAIRREVLGRVGAFDLRYRSAQDYDYWIRTALTTDFLVLHETLFYKRTHSKNVSRNKIRTASFRNAILRNLSTERGKMIRRNGWEPVCRSAVAESWHDLGNLHFEKGERARAFSCYAQGWLADPFSRKNTGRFFWSAAKKTARLASRGALKRPEPAPAPAPAPARAVRSRVRLREHERERVHAC